MTSEVRDVHGFVKPLLRGRLHLGAFVVSIPAAVVLVLLAGSTHARVASLVYGATLVGLFAVSSSYHHAHHEGRAQRLLRRADHASIYGLIAGSYTPIAVVAVGGWVGWALVIAAWTVAAFGILLKLVWFDHVSKLGGALYIVMGWMVVAAAPVVISSLTAPELILLLIGGVVYTGGSVVLATRRPDPNPRVFGYHEVWHSLVIAAAMCHYAAILQIVR